jgi:uncharacterized protein YegP (UPF0339 family)
MSKVKAEYFEGDNGLWYFRLKSRNGEQVAASEGYDSKANAKRAVQNLKRDMQETGEPDAET